MEKTAFTTYLTVLVLSILLFGAVHAYAYAFLILGVLGGTLLVVIWNIRPGRGHGGRSFRLLRTGMGPFVLLMLAFLIFQMVPLPEAVVGVVSPEAAGVRALGAVAGGEAAGDAHSGGWHALAPYLHPVRLSIIRWITYGLFFYGLVYLLNSRKRIDRAVFVILAVCTFDALYGMVETHSGSESVWWFVKTLHSGDVSGTYINRNHFAGCMEMGLLLATAYAAALYSGPREPAHDPGETWTVRSMLTAFLHREQAFSLRALVGVCGVIIGIGLIFSASRGGMIAAAGGLFLMAVLFVFRKGLRGRGLVILAVFGLILVCAVRMGVEYPMGRFNDFESAFQGRARMTEKTLELFRDYPAVGVGVGNFQYAYPRYQSAKDKEISIGLAHNDWAQFLAEAGVVGMGILVLGMGYYVWRLLRLWGRRKDPYAVCLGIAPVTALAAIGVHSYSDFNLHVPANVLLLTAILAIGYAALHLERHHRRDRMDYRYADLPLKYRGGVVLVLILALIGWTGWWTWRHFVAEAYCNTVPNSTLNRDQRPAVDKILKAVSWDGGNAGYWYKLAEGVEVGGGQGSGGRSRESGVRGQESEGRGRRAEGGGRRAEGGGQMSEVRGQGAEGGEEICGNLRNLRIMALEKSVELNPLEARYHLKLGWAYAHMFREPDYHIRWLPAADVSMDRAAYFAGVKTPRLHVELGNYWTIRSKTIFPTDPAHRTAWEKACAHYRLAQTLETGARLKTMKTTIRNFVATQYPHDDYLTQAVPP